MGDVKHTVAGEMAFDAVAPRMMRVGGIIGLLGLGASIFLGFGGGGASREFFHTYLLALVYFVSLSLGALFFVILQHLTRAGWSVAVRRVAEIMASSLPLLMLFCVPLIVGMMGGNGDLFPWADPAHMSAEHVLEGKKPYLNVSFFAVRYGLYFLAWALLSRYFLSRSVRQDDSGDFSITYQMQWVSAPAMAVFALSATFFAFDFIMSLEPTFYSTIFGVYFFAGCVLGFLSFTALLVMYLQGQGILKDVVTREHFHDMGKLMFGFVFFWGYIAFSQYMLIWYGNIPEETVWYGKRQAGNWLYVSLALLFGHLLLPFPGLLSRHVKRNRFGLAFWAVFLLVMHYVDLYWLIMPSTGLAEPPLGLLNVTTWLGFAGIFVANFGFIAKGKRVLPAKDPRLVESLTFENA